MSSGGDFWGGRPLPDVRMQAVSLSARINAAFGSSVQQIDRPAGMRFMGYQVLANGFFVKPGRLLLKTFDAGDITDAADTVTITTHGYSAGDGPFQLTTTGTLPTGLAVDTDYFIGVVDANTITFHSSQYDAAHGKNKLPISADGSGTHTIGIMPSADPTATDALGQSAVHITSTAGKGGEVAGVIAAPEVLTIRGDNAASSMVYWFLP